MKSYTIYEIQEMSVDTARNLAAGNRAKVKDHDVYFANLGAFGYSALVFYGEHHIYYADQFQLHFSHRPADSLRELFLEILSSILFTEEELCAPIADYDEYLRKCYFLNNYYGMREEKISIFRIGKTEAEEESYRSSVASRIFNPVCLGYYLPEKNAFVDRCIELQNKLNQQRDTMQEDYDYQKNAFLKEMFNHEYGYSGSPDYDVLQVFGNIEYKGDDEAALHAYFQGLGFSEVRQKAYRAAQKEYWATAVL